MQFSTKVFICVVGVLGNVGIWGDLTLDSVLAQQYGYKNKIDTKKCNRTCIFGQKPRTCVFDFRIEPYQNGTRRGLAINGMIPGPSIEVCAKDIIVVDVTNKLPGLELSMHWRGLTQRGSPYMDGVPMVTQCPIGSGTTFRYTFRAEDVGTHFYHAHSVSQQLRGIFGALIIRQPVPLEPTASLFGRERPNEYVLVISSRVTSQSIQLEVDGHSGLDGDIRRILVTKSHKYRVRVINAIPLNCPVAFSIAKHKMMIISSDGKPVKPTAVDVFGLLPGERFDFIFSADRNPHGYELKIKGLDLCHNLTHTAHVVYDDIFPGNNTTYETNLHEKYTPIFGQHLMSMTGPPADLTVSPVSQELVYLKVDTTTHRFEDDENEYRYLSDALPVPPFYPSELSRDDTQVVQINGKSFLYPNAPILSQPYDIAKRTICKVGREYKVKGVECVQVLEVDYKSTLELVIVDEGFGSNSTKVFHMHGNPMYVLSTSKSYDKGLKIEDVQSMEWQGKITRNLWNPPMKDTIYVPNKGFTIVRIIADNQGTWLLECPSCGISSLPTAIIIQVQPRLPTKVLKTLPKCGNYRPSDVLIH